jgi:hypothetical protein
MGELHDEQPPHAFQTLLEHVNDILDETLAQVKIAPLTNLKKWATTTICKSAVQVQDHFLQHHNHFWSSSRLAQQTHPRHKVLNPRRT